MHHIYTWYLMLVYVYQTYYIYTLSYTRYVLYVSPVVVYFNTISAGITFWYIYIWCVFGFSLISQVDIWTVRNATTLACCDNGKIVHPTLSQRTQ